jgi:hypothetical protein
VIGDLFSMWSMLRDEARENGCDEEFALKEFAMWLWAIGLLSVAGLILWRLWLIGNSLAVIAEKLS